MSIFSRLDGVPGTTAVPPVAGRMSGPFPNTNTRKLFTPAASDNPDCATSAKPFATGKTPPTPGAGAVHVSNAPAQSAKLIIIDGVAPKADGFANKPSVA